MKKSILSTIIIFTIVLTALLIHPLNSVINASADDSSGTSTTTATSTTTDNSSNDSSTSTGNTTADTSSTTLISYQDYLAAHPNGSLVNADISINVNNYTADGGMTVTTPDAGAILTTDAGSITWTFNVQTEGFYNLNVDYYPYAGKTATIQRELLIDGAIPFKGADQIQFSRIWEDAGPITIEDNNEIRPNQVEAPQWTDVYVTDSQMYTEGPYEFYLTAGSHTLTFVSIAEPLEIKSLDFEASPAVPTYSQYISDMQSKYSVYDGSNITFQAERVGGPNNATTQIYKSSPMLYPIPDFSSSLAQPYHPYYIRLNTIGGYNWRVTGDWIEWDITVPKDGLYELSLAELQNTNRGEFSSRELLVNGQVPFQEAYSINFSYNSAFQMYTIGNNGNPYLLHLTKGTNTITLKATLGPMGPLVQRVNNDITILNNLYNQITEITGLTPDKFIDYQLTTKLPNMQSTFESQAKDLNDIANQIQSLSGGTKSNQTAIISQMATELDQLAKSPDKIISQIALLENNITALSTWALQASEQPLEIDYFVLSAPHAKLPNVTPNIFEKVYYTLLRFVSTFFIDYNSFATSGSKSATTITVWMQSGRDQAQILKNLIDNSFTPQNNINVQLELVPTGVVLPATLAGNGPDVALNLSGDTTVNFAMRDAAVNLTQFPDFQQVASRFMPSAFAILNYQGGVYGLPETQSFYMMFYRKDILSELGLPVPTTWTQLESEIPTLEMHNYQVYMPTTLQMYSIFLYQNGGVAYNGTGDNLGISSGLDSQAALEAFKEWTDFYTSYKLPVQADFPNRFRSGQMPIGIADYTTFNTLAVFAPEISGLWGFAPVPGTVLSDGTVNNVSASTVGNCMMLKTSKHQDASWDFMKWWTSAATQVAYGNALESVMGAAARYATANIQALSELPWSSADYAQLSAQFNNTFQLPELPGSYITAREVNNSFYNVVNTGENPLEALYLNVKPINQELTMKREEFGLSVASTGGN